MRLNLHSNGGNRHTLSEMCLTPVLINHPAVIAVIVIEGCGEGGNVTFEGVSVMFGLRIRIICGCLSALNGGVSGIVVSAHRVVISFVVSGCTLMHAKIFDYLSRNRPDCGWCAYGNYSVSSGLEDA